MLIAGVFLLSLVAATGTCFGAAFLAKVLFAVSKWLESRGVRLATAFNLPALAVIVLGAAITMTVEFTMLRPLVSMPPR